MKKFLLFLTMTLLTSLYASADFELSKVFAEKNEDDVEIFYYQTDVDNEVLVCKKIDGTEYTGEVKVPSTVIHYGKAYTVVGVREGAFFECRYDLSKVILPETVRTIGDHAFMKCYALTSVELPEGLVDIGRQAFDLCYALAFINLGPNIEHIGEFAFRLTPLVAKKENRTDNVAYVGDYALYQIDNKSKITVREGTRLIADKCFYYDDGKSLLTEITLPSTLRHIGNTAFMFCERLKSINLPEGLLSIGDNCFAHCKSLPYADIPDSVEELGYASFFDCTSIQSLVIPKNLKQIREATFMCCESLKLVVVPANVQKIDVKAFSNCTSLVMFTVNRDFPENILVTGDPFIGCDLSSAYLYVPGGSETRYSTTSPWSGFGTIYAVLNSYSFCELNVDDIPIYYNINPEDSSTVSVTYRNDDYASYSGRVQIPSTVVHDGQTYTVTAIGKEAFKNCTGLKNVDIPRTVTSIGSYAFAGCKQLKEINLPNTLTEIGTYAFTNCYAMRSILIPKSVTTIGTRAFLNCKLLTSVMVENEVPANLTVGSEVFALTNIANGALNVPLSSVSQYQSASPWNTAGFGNFYHMNFDFSNISAEGLTVYYRYDFIENGVHVSNRLEDDPSYSGELVIPSTIKDHLGNTYPVIGIADYAFEDCYALTSLYIPSSVKTIGKAAFLRANNFNTITVDVDYPENITFVDNNPGFTLPQARAYIYVPQGSRDRYYSTSPWDYFNRAFIVEMDGTTNYDFSELNAQQVPIYYKNNTDGTNTVSVVARTESHSTYTGDIEIPSEVSHNGEQYSVTAIDDNAFYGCIGLTSVTMSKGIKRIGSNAFKDCTALADVAFSSSLRLIENGAFRGCTSLQSVELPVLLTDISGTAFYSCENLSRVTMGPNIAYIGTRAFANCPALSHVEIEANKAWKIEYGNEIFKNIGEGATLYVPKRSSERYGYITHWRDNFNIVELPYVFWGVTSGNKIYYDINDDDQTLSVTCRDTNYNSYSGYVTVPTWATYDNETYMVTEVAERAFYQCKELVSVTLGKGMKIIGDEAFYQCESLRVLTLHDNVTTIGRSAFYGCKVLYQFELPESTTTIKPNAFNGCRSLHNVTMAAKGLMTIGDGAFANCTSLSSLTMENSSPANITLGDNVFEGSTDDTALYVPRIGKADYETADQWKDFANIYQLDLEPGDVNGDGSVSAIDIIYIINYMLGTDYSAFDEEAADINGDGKIDTTDISILIQWTNE